ncbi:MAG: hypothetical protein JW982_11255 [Spirochaetes bacterium]|nr:hypothetical protein [Spirochaetota bacterium]
MKENIFDIRNIYRISEDKKRVYIDIQLDFYREIYSVWDFSPIANRDLDEDLFEYLEACAVEIPPKYKIVIVFHIPHEIRDNDKETKSIAAYKNFFNYRIRRIKAQQNNKSKSIFLYLLLGIICITSSILINRYFPENIISIFFSEGLTIGSWVVFWELFYFIFFARAEVKKEEKIMKRLAGSDIEYKYRSAN